MILFLRRDVLSLAVDLIPKANAQAWLKYLRHSTPTLPFLSNATAQHQRTNISSSTAPSLLKLLKAYKPKAGSVTIGVVGYPNVGKSSLINSLKRSKVCHSFLGISSVLIISLEGLRCCSSGRTHEGSSIRAAGTWNAHHRLTGCRLR